jgi:transposase-like protein
MKRTHQTFSEQEKDKLLREIANSRGSTWETLAQLGISKSTYYRWKAAAEIGNGLRPPTENSPRNFYLIIA